MFFVLFLPLSQISCNNTFYRHYTTVTRYIQFWTSSCSALHMATSDFMSVPSALICCAPEQKNCILRQNDMDRHLLLPKLLTLHRRSNFTPHFPSTLILPGFKVMKNHMGVSLLRPQPLLSHFLSQTQTTRKPQIKNRINTDLSFPRLRESRDPLFITRWRPN